MSPKIKIDLSKVTLPVMQPIRDVTRGDPPPPLDYGFMHPLRETLLYSRGGVGKGVIASYFAAQDTLAGKRIGILAYEPHPDEWFRRIDGFGGDLDMVDIALPVSEEYGWLHGPIWKQADEIRAYCQATGIERLYIDSLMPATKAGGDGALSDPSLPDDFFGATRTIGVPSLVLGHLSASATRDNLWKPWGSVFWVNYSRMAWSAWFDSTRKVVELTNQKRNVYGKEGPYDLDWAWADELDAGDTPPDLDFKIGTVTITKLSQLVETLRDLAPDPQHAVAKTTVARALGGKYKTALAKVQNAMDAGTVGVTDSGRIFALAEDDIVPETVPDKERS